MAELEFLNANHQTLVELVEECLNGEKDQAGPETERNGFPDRSGEQRPHLTGEDFGKAFEHLTKDQPDNQTLIQPAPMIELTDTRNTSEVAQSQHPISRSPPPTRRWRR